MRRSGRVSKCWRCDCAEMVWESPAGDGPTSGLGRQVAREQDCRVNPRLKPDAEIGERLDIAAAVVHARPGPRDWTIA